MPSTPATPASYIKGTANGGSVTYYSEGIVLTPATTKTMLHTCRTVSDVISSSMLVGEMGGHAGGELAIYTKLK